jgi:type IV secretion system protein VirB10
LQDIRKPQLVPQELKIGTIIPAILLTGIDSDLPGQLLAQVSENVYDTATGKFLLIPQGSRLVGIYDSQISYGQKRLMAVWTHLIWPDGSSLNLSGMPGIDPSGYSGFRGRVDNHYLELFLTAVVVSGFNFGYEAITDEDRNAYGNDNSTSNKIKDAVGEAVAALGARIAEREIARAPTIRIKPGYRFNVMLNKDIVFPSAWVEP